MDRSRRRTVGRSSDPIPVTREEYEQLRTEVAAIRSRLPVFRGVEPVVSDDSDVDDSYAPRFFSTHLDAIGVDLPAGNSSLPPTDRRVRWLDGDGVMVANVIGYDEGGVKQAALEAFGDIVAGTDASAWLTAMLPSEDPGGGLRHGTASLTGYAQASANGDAVAAGLKAVVSSIDDTGTYDAVATILNESGESTFLQLDGSLAKRTLALGTTTVTGDGTVAKQRVIAHGLDSAPVFANAITEASTLAVSLESTDATNITFEFRNINALNWSDTFTLYWIAIA